jgi:hypothetical protein
VKLHTMFLRQECPLPAGLRLTKKQFDKGWVSAEDITSSGLDWAVRRAGWHFIWVEMAVSGVGCSRTESIAENHAIARGLSRIRNEFNGGELISMRASKRLGFWIVRVTMHARQIQQQTALSVVDRPTLRQPSLG